MSFTNFKTTECLISNAEEIEQLTKNRMAELNALLELKLRSIKKAPEGSLRITQSHNSVQYYHIINKGDNTGTYIPAEHRKLAVQLAQKDYDKKVTESAAKEIKFLSKILKNCTQFFKKNTLAEKIFQNLHKNRRTLVEPVKLSDEEYAARWQAINYKKDFTPENKNYRTIKDEVVRSKSEILIADTLNRMNIPYHYEFPIKLLREDGTKTTFHPDFLCLNRRTRKEFLWEHFGRMDDAEYASQTVSKLNLFAHNGIFPGKNLITTMETATQPLNTRQIEKLAEEFLI